MRSSMKVILVSGLSADAFLLSRRMQAEPTWDANVTTCKNEYEQLCPTGGKIQLAQTGACTDKVKSCNVAASLSTLTQTTKCKNDNNQALQLSDLQSTIKSLCETRDTEIATGKCKQKLINACAGEGADLAGFKKSTAKCNDLETECPSSVTMPASRTGLEDGKCGALNFDVILKTANTNCGKDPEPDAKPDAEAVCRGVIDSVCSAKENDTWVKADDASKDTECLSVLDNGVCAQQGGKLGDTKPTGCGGNTSYNDLLTKLQEKCGVATSSKSCSS